MTIKIQKPTKGRVVLFTAARGQGDDGDVTDEYTAHITGVHVHDNGVVDLVTFGSSSIYFQHDVPHDDNKAAGTWRYPPFTKEEIEVER